MREGMERAVNRPLYSYGAVNFDEEPEDEEHG